MSCTIHEYLGEYPCPWPGCQTDYARDELTVADVDRIDPSSWCRFPDEDQIPEPRIELTRLRRQQFYIQTGLEISNLYHWGGLPPELRPLRLAKPDYQREDNVRLIRGRQIKEWIDAEVDWFRGRYQTLDARPIPHIVADAIGPWIGGMIMVGVVVVAWARATGAI